VITIVNPASAGGRLGREWPRIERLLRDSGVEVQPVFTEQPWHAIELAEAAVRDGEQVVAAAGGDGTVFETAMGLQRAGGGTLSILPLGTGNDVARTLGVPLRLPAAARVAAEGAVREVDLIRIGEYLVPNAIGIGLTADISERAANIKWIRGLVVYLATAVVSLVRFPTPRVRISSPDGVLYDGDMTIIAIHNGPTSGGGFRLTPQAVPDDGLLDLTLVPGIGPLGRVPRLVAAMRGTLGDKRGTIEGQFPWLELEFDETLAMHVDGNLAKLEPPGARFEVISRALKVKVPLSSKHGENAR